MDTNVLVKVENIRIWLDPGMWWKPDVKGVEGPSVLGRLPTPDSPTESESF